jgi:putative transposase
MLDINTFILILSSCLDATTLGRLRIIVLALLSMSGRVTMRGISRWAEEGGRYRTIQRFFDTPIDWDKVNWFLVRHYFLKEEDNPIIIAGDETVVTKSGKNTYGLNRFFSSLYGKAVPGLSYFAFSLVSTKMRTSECVKTQNFGIPFKFNGNLYYSGIITMIGRYIYTVLKCILP